MNNILKETVRGTELIPLEDMLLEESEVFLVDEITPKSANNIIQKLMYLDSKDLGVFHYEMFCTEDNLLPLLRELYLMYTNYADETKERLAEIENHMRIIVEKAMNPI